MTAKRCHGPFHGLHEITGAQMDIDVCRLKDTMTGNSSNLVNVQSHARKVGQTKVPDRMGRQLRQFAAISDAFNYLVQV